VLHLFQLKAVVFEDGVELVVEIALQVFPLGGGGDEWMAWSGGSVGAPVFVCWWWVVR
jgi:hypothetical protein